MNLKELIPDPDALLDLTPEELAGLRNVRTTMVYTRYLCGVGVACVAPWIAHEQDNDAHHAGTAYEVETYSGSA